MGTRAGQKLREHFLSVKEDFVTFLMTKLSTSGVHQYEQPAMFVNTDETAEYFEAKPKSTVHSKGKRIVPILHSGSSIRRLTACVSVHVMEKKLSLFLFFKQTLKRSSEKNQSYELPKNVFRCCHTNR